MQDLLIFIFQWEQHYQFDTYFMKKDVSYREFTSYFLNKLKSRKDELFQAVNSTNGDYISDLIIQLLKDNPNASEYAQFIQKKAGLKTLFRRLRNINSNISQSLFQDSIEVIRKELDQKLEKFAADSQGLTMLMSIVKDMINKEDKHGDIEPKMSIPARDAVTQKMDKNNSGYQSNKDMFKKNNNSKPPQIQDKKLQPSYSSKQIKPPNPKIQSPVVNKQGKPNSNIESPVVNKKQEFNEQIKGGKVIDIDSSKLQVEIRYLHTSVDYQNYKYNKASLKESLHAFIKKYLKENSITVLTQSLEVRIMDDTSYIKSKQAGNYRFNPFCDVVEIFIKAKDKNKFSRHFKAIGNVDAIKIDAKKIDAKEWNKSMMNLGPKSSIQELVEYICNKRQASQLIEPLVKGLTQFGGANIVQDLYGWQRSDYSGLKVKPTFIFQIQQLIELIKDSSQVGNGSYSLSQRKKQCIKMANSHKILRYAIYSTLGSQGVKRIAWLNMENLKVAIKIVREQIYNEQLLDQLDEYFNQFALNPDDKPIAFSRGLVLYGPPGTGKTVLTEALPNIIGFHLIEKGLSAADFMKSLVGESSRMIRDLVNRASVSPYLLCSVGIDQVDGLVPDRKDKDQKNKGEGISMLLSVIGGNKDVSNLVFMTSTNYLKKIDEAIRRRLSGQYQVGRPNPWARTQIILGKLDYLKGKTNLLNHMIKITTNFTGAAIGSLANFLLKSTKIKAMEGKPIQLTINEVTQAAILIARQFSIKLGVYTLPQIYSSQSNKKIMFTETFLQKIANHFMIVKFIKDNDFSIMYATETVRYSQGQLIPIYEKEEDKINIPVDRKNDFQAFIRYIQATYPRKKYDIVCFRQKDVQSYQQYKKRINIFLAESQKKRMKNKKIVMIIQDFKGYEGGLKFDAKLLERDNKNLYIFYYLLPHTTLSEFSAVTFGEWKSREEEQKSGKKQNNSFGNQSYSGRIMVELNRETRMAFELNSAISSQSKVFFKFFLKSDENTSPKAVIPQLVDFFTKQQVSYILLIDYQLLLQNDAFEEKKVLEVMEEKMMEAKNYERVAVIINLDSMIMLNQNASDSNFGRSMSYSIQNYNLYQILLNYMREFATINGRTSRWMTVIAKHPQLISIAKKHLDWPSYPEQLEKQKEEQAKDEEKKCARCFAIYTERTNEQERKCMQHVGKIIDTRTKTFETSTPEQLRARKYKKKGDKEDDKKNDDDRYVYACCQKGLNQQGCRSYYHLEEREVQSMKDDLYNEKLNSNDKWNQVIKYY